MRIASRSTVTASDNQLPCLSTVPPRYFKKDELNIKKKLFKYSRCVCTEKNVKQLMKQKTLEREN